MILIFALICTLPYYQGDATPLESQNFVIARQIIDSNDTSTSHTFPDPSQCTCPSQRSVWDIVWSCLATIFLCSWVSVHPNIPDANDSKLKVAMRRLELMFWAVITPEMIMWWAFRQWFGARRLAAKYQRFGWTKTHGFFIQMGGFMLHSEDGTKTVLSPRRLEELYKAKRINIPAVSEEEIWDRSKADALSKTLVLGQTAWFVVQCISRHIQHLVITEFELVTAAFAFLNGFMYFLWWNKPLDARTPITVYLLETSHDKHCIVIKNSNTGPVAHNRRRLIFSCYQTVKELDCSKCLHGLYNLVMFPFLRLQAMSLQDVIPSETATHAPTFYALDTAPDEFIKAGIAIAAIATIFGHRSLI